MKKYFVILLTGLISFNFGFTQLTTDNSMTAQQLVEDYLVGSGVQVFNVTYNGADEGRGIFNGVNSNVGLEDGIILSCGDIANAIGPNDNSSVAGQYSGMGDADLETLAGINTNDAAILEFDFIPASDTLTFEYVFGSDEYMEYVGGGINDAFGFFLSGPGINGTYSNNAENIALIPGTATPVTIDNVNANTNSAYYIDNGDGSTAPMNTDNTYIQYDGLTQVLIATAIVTACDTFHIKLAIADGSDDYIDSGVFLKGGSFSAGPSVELTAIGSDAEDLTVIEGCSDAVFTFVRPGSTVTEHVVNFEITGNAQNGVDYASVADSVVFEIGEDTVQLIISPIIDNISELVESITITIPLELAPCDTSEPSFNTATILFLDNEPLQLEATNNMTVCTGDEITFVATATVGGGVVTYEWDNSLGTDSLVALEAPEESTTYSVTVRDECNNAPVVEEVEVTIQCPVVPSNIFTPGNGDGMNDYFNLLNLEQYPESRLQVFDRWGAKIYDDPSYQNNWDGRVKNSEKFASAGTYYYIVHASDGKEFHGYVTIVR